MILDLAQLTALYDWCREHGVSQVRVGDVHLVIEQPEPGVAFIRPAEPAAERHESMHDRVRRMAAKEE